MISITEGKLLDREDIIHIIATIKAVQTTFDFLDSELEDLNENDRCEFMYGCVMEALNRPCTLDELKKSPA